MNIRNFANRQLYEYQTIFPNTVSLLDHLLFTNGNGFRYGERKGMIYDDSGTGKNYIDQFPEMTDQEWDALIAACHAKERKFHEQYARHGLKVDEVELAEDCAKYKRVSVSASDFSENELFHQLREMQRIKTAEAFEFGRYPTFVRPYPLSPGYAIIFDLNEKTPGWFLQIAYNLCRAWVRFLDDEIRFNNVWVKPSLRPAPTERELTHASAMEELFSAIKEDSDYDGWLDKPVKEPQSDYGDLTWTTKHRDMLAVQAQRIAQLMIDSSNFKVGDKLVVKIRDPYWTYAGCAEPMPGSNRVVTSLQIAEPEAAGKVEVKFRPKELGYGGRSNITLYLRPWMFEKQ